MREIPAKWQPFYTRYETPTAEKLCEAIEEIADLQTAMEEKEAELERFGSIEGKAHLQTIDERDRAEESLGQAYYLITGRSPEWSNLFGHEEAIEEIDDFQKCVRADLKRLEAEIARLTSPVSDEEMDNAWKAIARSWKDTGKLPTDKDAANEMLAARSREAQPKEGTTK